MDVTILVADDDAMIRQLVRLMLEPVGYKIIEAVDGFDALEKVKKHQPDVLLLNILMPNLDGITVCKMLRKEKASATLPIILLTGQAQLSVINKGLQAGATNYLTKPMSRQELLRTLRQAIDEK